MLTQSYNKEVEMKINNNDRIEMAVGEIFIYKGVAVTTVEDNYDDLIPVSSETFFPHCCKCCFLSNLYCYQFECRGAKREDRKCIHFEKMGGEII